MTCVGHVLAGGRLVSSSWSEVVCLVVYSWVQVVVGLEPWWEGKCEDGKPSEL